MTLESRGKITSFTKLKAWEEAHRLVIMTYRETKSFPREEQLGLASQLRRAVVSITSNIAEGFSRTSYKEKVQFYIRALGSLTEAPNQLLVARDVGYLALPVFGEVSAQSILVSKLLNGLIKKTRDTASHS